VDFFPAAQVVEERNRLPNRPPLLVKISPDLTAGDKEDIAAVVTREEVIDQSNTLGSTTLNTT